MNILFSSALVVFFGYFIPFGHYLAAWVFVYSFLSGKKAAAFLIALLSAGVSAALYFSGRIADPSFLVYSVVILVTQVAASAYISERIGKNENPGTYLFKLLSVIAALAFVFFSYLIFSDRAKYLAMFIPEAFITRLLSGGLDASQARTAEWMVQKIRELMLGISALSVYLGGLISFAVARKVFSFRGINLAGFDMKKVRCWRPPDITILLLIISVAMMIAGDRFFPALELFGRNCALLLLALYFINGIMIFDVFSAVAKIPKGMKIVVYLFSFIVIYFSLVFLFLGIIDMWTDFRKTIFKLKLKDS